MIVNIVSARGAAGTGRDVLLLLLVAGLLFSFGVGQRALWNPDEGRYAEIPREMVHTGDYITPRINGVKYFEKPPLFYWLQSGAIKVFGINGWSLHLWNVLLALAGCLAVYAAGRSLYHRRAGLAGAAVLATSPLYFFLARTITLDMAVSVLLTLGLLAFVLGVRAPNGATRHGYFLAFYAFAALATLTKGLIGIVLPALIIGIWIALLGEWRLLRRIHLPVGIALFFIIVAPWHVLVARENPEFLQFYFIHEHFQRYLTTVHHHYQPVWFFIPVLLAGLLPWTAFLAQAVRDALPRSWESRRDEPETVFLLVWIATVLVFFSFSESKLVPYILPAAPPLALLLGRYLTRDGHPDGMFWMRRGYLAVCIGSFAAIAMLLAIWFLPSARIALGAYTERLGNYLFLWIASLAVLALLPLLWIRANRIGVALLSLLFGAGVTLSSVAASLPRLDAYKSVKELALVLKSRLRAQDEIMSYSTYFQDLPVYLNQRVTVVAWKGELEFGMQQEDTGAWMIDEPTFRNRWRGDGTVYLFVSLKTLDRLDGLGRPYFVLAQTVRNALVTNRSPNS